MTRLLWLPTKIVGAAVILLSFLMIYSALYVRGAIQHGALSNPSYSCLHPRDKVTLNSGPNQSISDWWLNHQIRRFRKAEEFGVSGWHWHGFITTVGLGLTTEPAERIEMAYKSMGKLPECKLPFRTK